MPEQTPAAPQHVHHADLNYQLPAEAAPALQMVASPNGDGSVAAWREGYQTKHFPGPRVHQRVHIFDDVESFAAYLNRHAAPLGLQVEILMAADGRITAALDPSRTNGDLIACDLVPHPRFTAWHRWLVGEARGPRERLTQRDFFALLRARGGDVVAGRDVTDGPPGVPLVPTIGQQLLAAVQSLRLTKDGSRQIDIDQHGYTRFSGGDERRQVVGSFPPSFWLDVPVFDAVYAAPVPLVARTDGEPLDLTPGAISVLPEGVELARTVIRGELRSYRFEVLLWLEVDGPEPMFQLQAPELDLVMREARRDAAAYLASLLDAPLMVGLGALELANVPAAGIYPGGDPPAAHYRPHRGAPAR